MPSESPNYISICNNTANASFLYVSESITEALGWLPDEVIGKPVYNYLHENERIAITRVHASTVMNERMSSMTRYRTLHKDGRWVTIESLAHYCYDTLVCSNFVYHEDDIRQQMRKTSVDELWVVSEDGTLKLLGAWNDCQHQMQKTLATVDSWINNRTVHRQEPRFCLIMNRFTNDCTIVFISQMAEKIVGTRCDQAIGKSVLEFVGEHDTPMVQAQLDMVKRSNMVTRMRFDWVLDKERNTTERVEAISSSTNDGVVIVVRLAPRVTIRRV